MMLEPVRSIKNSFFGSSLCVSLVMLLTLFLVGCSVSDGSGNGSHSSKPIAPYCMHKKNFADESPVTVNGTAKFEYRENGNGLIKEAPIRYAEIRVTNAAGEVVQCAETDGNGEFSFPLPGDGADYTVSVLSRANNAHNTAYVLNNPTDNEAYAVSKTIKASGSPNFIMTAKATGDLKGGAFNILDQIYKAQKFLRDETKDCNQIFADCVPFTTAPVAYIYWTPGLSPGVYVGVSGAISYYLGGTYSLYIGGGENGNTTYTDTDHFDNSVIIHEYAHFIEDVFGKPDSPGGSHNANSIIDPRLAWGEGFANYFQAAVLGINYYRDTYGVGEVEIRLDEPADSAKFDKPLDDGEGNFREISVARVLYKATRTPSAVSTFAEVWTILRGPTNGFNGISDRFKSIGRFHVIQRALQGESWSAIRAEEKHTGNLANFATPLKNCGSDDPAQAMSVYKDGNDTGSYATSNLLRNNDFFVYHHPGGPFSATLSWNGADEVDLDLYVYKEGYYFGDSSTMAAYSDLANLGFSGSETIKKSLPAGSYMINVMAFTGFYKGTDTFNTSYILKINGENKCPDPGP